jgi:hypothetical protein
LRRVAGVVVFGGLDGGGEVAKFVTRVDGSPVEA